VAERGVARTFQNIALFRGMTVLDNLMLGRHVHMKTGVLGAFAFTMSVPLILLGNGLGAIVVGVVLPLVARGSIERTVVGSTEFTLIGALAAILVVFGVLRRLMAYPGIWALSFVLPSFVSTYLLTILVFFFARIDYARVEFAASFDAVVAWAHHGPSPPLMEVMPSMIAKWIGRAAHSSTTMRGTR
jgi:ABC-type sugar transport system ATPase subunit